MLVNWAADLSRSLDCGGDTVFVVGTFPCTRSGRRLRLRNRKYGDKFCAKIGERMAKSFGGWDRPGSSPRMLPTGWWWWRSVVRPRHVRPAPGLEGEMQGPRRPQKASEMQGLRRAQRCKAPRLDVGLPPLGQRSCSVQLAFSQRETQCLCGRALSVWGWALV